MDVITLDAPASPGGVVLSTGRCDLNGNAMPALEGRPADEILGYDEDGLPERRQG
jgi:hypothetical protein